jgi:hypothetical protein
MLRARWAAKASGRSKLTREPRQINAQLERQTGAELSALFVRRCLVPLSGLCRPVWISRMTKPAEDRVAGEFNPAGRLTDPCDISFNRCKSLIILSLCRLVPRNQRHRSLGTGEIPRLYPRVERSGRWKLAQELKQVPAHWESEWAPNCRRFS